MLQIIKTANHIVWGMPVLLLILGVGIYLSVRTRFAQIRHFGRALRAFMNRLRGKNEGENGQSSFRALCTALAATVGTGNLAGVAGAISIGGPGAIFWMWVCAFFGMVTKYAEATLAVRYQIKGNSGENMGGPMYMISQGLHKRWHFLAVLYSFFGVIAAFGVGNATQINTLIGSINTVIYAYGGSETMFGNFLMGVGIAVLIGVLLLGGAKRIGTAAERLVPFASALYLLLGFGVLFLRTSAVSDAFLSIFKGAFCPQAVTGGVLGSAFQALRIGASRGVFTNEAGMGTASIAHAGANVKHPAEQGLMGIMEVFIDTVVICTMTALVILCSGVSVPYGTDTGIVLTTDAFSHIYGQWVCIALALCVCCFALATVLGWGLYGIRCAQYLFGEHIWRRFVLFQVIAVILGSVLKTCTVWLLSETVNGLMAIPNLIALAALTPELVRLDQQFRQRK